MRAVLLCKNTKTAFRSLFRRVKNQVRKHTTHNIQIASTAADKHTVSTTTSAPKPLNYKCEIKTPLTDSIIPDYLKDVYWWAYIQPYSVKFWDRPCLTNTILWGNYSTLSSAAFTEVHQLEKQQKKKRTLDILQITCVYGEFSNSLAKLGHRMNIVDVAPIQLLNAKRKLDKHVFHRSVGLYQNNSENLHSFEDNSQDLSFLFLLLHEQPEKVRKQTLSEAIRVTNFANNGKLVIIDYHQPCSRWNPFRYIMYPILTYIEPFAIDLWHTSIESYIVDILQQQQQQEEEEQEETKQKLEPRSESDSESTEFDLNVDNYQCTKELYFGGLYQKIILSIK